MLYPIVLRIADYKKYIELRFVRDVVGAHIGIGSHSHPCPLPLIYRLCRVLEI